MSLKIKYNADGSITVSCGGEEVTVFAERAEAASPPTTTTAPSQPKRPGSPIVGPPKTGPRVMIRLPGMVQTSAEDDPDDLSSAFELKSFISLGKKKGLPLISAAERDAGNPIKVKVMRKQSIDVRTLLDLMRTVRGVKPLDLHLWMMPEDTER